MNNFSTDKFLIILISPSGGGKSTIAKHILSSREDIAYSVSYTTRPPRGSEINGIHYNFIDNEEFFSRKSRGDFLESAQVHNYYYATSKSFILDMLSKGKHVIMDIDVQGALQLQDTGIPTVTIFIIPPSEEILHQRLTARATDTEEVIKIRLNNAKDEIKQISKFDYLVINDKLDTAIKEIDMIISTEELRVIRYNNIDDSFYGG